MPASHPLIPSALEAHLSPVSPVAAAGCHPVNGSWEVSHQPRRQSCHNVAIITIGSVNEPRAILDMYISLPRERCLLDEEYWLGVLLMCGQGVKTELTNYYIMQYLLILMLFFHQEPKDACFSMCCFYRMLNVMDHETITH